jgi:DNA polymerase-3 subunit gamma/tau
MGFEALYSRWRPMTFDDVVGQEHVTQTLRNALMSERVGHAYLFAGPRGTGKTTMARLLAKAVNCLHDDPALRPCNECRACVAVNEGRFLDLIEIDAASHTSVDDVRELRDRIAFAPNEGRFKVYIIDEVHRFSGAAFDALLKTIEEPPSHAIFVLATTEIHKVPQTILSRCQRFDFRRIPLDQIIARLEAILDYEGIAAEPAALELVARQATGSLRDAISLLEQLITGPDQVLTLDLARAILGTAADESVIALTDALLDGDVGAGLDVVNHALDEGSDARQFARQVVEYLRLVMLVQTGGMGFADVAVTEDEMAIVEYHAAHLPRRALLAALRYFNEAAGNQQSGWQPQLPLEIAFVESVEVLYASPAPAQSAPPAQSVPAAAPRPDRPSESRPAPEQPAGERIAAPEPEPGAAAPPESEAELSLADVHARWDQILDITRRYDETGMIQALLRTGSLYGVEGDRIILQMPGDVLCAKIEDDENRRVIEAAFEQVFNRALRVGCRAQQSGAVVEQKTRAVDDLIANDSLVSFAVNDLGGSISHIEDQEE